MAKTMLEWKDGTGQPEGTPLALAMAYVPWQQWEEVYESEVGFRRGTLFAQLDKPFLGEEATTRG